MIFFESYKTRKKKINEIEINEHKILLSNYTTILKLSVY